MTTYTTGKTYTSEYPDGCPYAEFYSNNDRKLRIVKLPDAYRWEIVQSCDSKDIGVEYYSDIKNGHVYPPSAAHISANATAVILAGGTPLRIVILEFGNIYKNLMDVWRLLEQ